MNGATVCIFAYLTTLPVFHGMIALFFRWFATKQKHINRYYETGVIAQAGHTRFSLTFGIRCNINTAAAA